MSHALFYLSFLFFFLGFGKVLVSAFTGRLLFFFTYFPFLPLPVLVYDFLSFGILLGFLHGGGSHGVVYPWFGFETVLETWMHSLRLN